MPRIPTPDPVLAARHPLARQPTERWGWVVAAGAATLLGAAMVVENAVYPKAAVTGLVGLSIAVTALACLVAYAYPFVGLAISVALIIAQILVPGMPHGGGTGLIVALFLVGWLSFRLPGRWSVLAWLVAALSPGVSLLVRAGDLFEPVFYVLFLAPAWGVGTLLRREQTRSGELRRLADALAAEREHRTETALMAERARISRELHDAVAHSVSVMTLQVGVVRRRLATGSIEQETLIQAERLGRQSVDELRRIVGLVRPAAPELAPVPSLRHLQDLVSEVRTTGTRVTLTGTDSLPELSPATDVSAYRIVQESLTNALRHAPGATVAIRLEPRGDDLVLTVADDQPDAPAMPVPGNGLTGMRERVDLLGGTLAYGRGSSGGFEITVTLPVAAGDLAGQRAG